MTTTIELPLHRHGGEEHTHDGGHRKHRHGDLTDLQAPPYSEGGEYDEPKFLVTLRGGNGDSRALQAPAPIVCSEVNFLGSYMRYTPAKGWGDHNGRTFYVAMPENIESVEMVD